MLQQGSLRSGRPTDPIVGSSSTISALRAQIRHLAAFDAVGNALVPTLLLQGETGTGKGLVARVIHDSGPRAQGPFVEVNCAAIPDSLLEAELFGFEAGAFTDARRAKTGLFEAASRGTLFLDEIDALPLTLQSKLLKAIEEKRVRRLGAVDERPVDVKLVAATQAELSERVAAGRFRADLYHRLAVVVLALPPLRERGEDVLTLARHFLAQYAAAYGLAPKRLSRAAEQWLLRYGWPGNVRELGHLMERGTLLSAEPLLDGDALERLSLPRLPSGARRAPGTGRDGDQPPDELSRIRQTLARTGGNVVRTARLLGLSRNALRYRMRRYGIERPAWDDPPPSRASLEGRGAAPRPGGHRTVLPAEPLESAPSWEQKPVAVLAIDLAFPTAVGLDAERYEPWTVVTRWEQAIAEKVGGFGGIMLQRSGPLLTAVFGVPRALEQMPHRAVQTALAIRHLVTDGAPASQGEPCPEVRMGVHLGPVLVDARADDHAARLLAVGETLALPVRLLGYAAPGEVLVSPEVDRLVGGGFRLEARALPSSTGRPGQVGTIAIAGLGPGQMGRAARRDRPASRLVGRERELETLHELLALVEAGRGQVAGIVGEPGMGKSRLLEEFHRRVAAERATYLEGRCLAYGSAIPYLPVLDLVRQHCGVVESDSPDAIADKLRLSLQAVGMAPDEAALLLLRLLAGPAGRERLAMLSSQAIKARTFDALRQLSVRASRTRPLVIVVEDAHWIDRTSAEYLTVLAESIPDARILLISTFRPGCRPLWLEAPSGTVLALEPLSPTESLCVLRAVCGAEPLPEPVMQSILRRAEGNPFFLEELARAVGEHRELSQAPAVPATIHDVLMARIDRLPDGPRRLLQTASVIGKEVPLGLLGRIWDGQEPLAPNLRELTRLEFLSEQRETREPVYVFKHALTQEVAYGSLLAAQRQKLHAGTGRALEMLYADRLGEACERLAYHYSKAADADKAVAYLTRVAEKAAQGHAHAEAVTALEEALSHVERLSAGERDRCRVALCLRLAHSLYFLGRARESMDLLLRQRELVEGLSDPVVAAPYYVVLGRAYNHLGEHEGATASARRAIEEASRCGDEATTGKAHYVLAMEGYWSGQPRRGIESSLRAASCLEKTEERYWLGQSYRMLGFNYALTGAFEPALEATARAQAIGEAIGNPHLYSHAMWGAGWIRATRGEWAAGIDACQRGLERTADPGNAALALGYLGAAYLEQGDRARAVDLLQQSVRQVGQLGFRRARSWFTAFLAEAHRLLGQLDRARELADEGLDLAREAKCRAGAAWAERALGRIALASGDLGEARRHLREAVATFAAMDARFEIGRTRLALAELAQAQGKPHAVARHLAEARQAFQVLGVPRYLERSGQLAKA